jgi:3-dehydroquinate dehydratase-2
MLRISIVNGPNLNLLGTREPAIYGNQYFESYVEDLKEMFPSVSIVYFQSNIEGELINALHNAIDTADAVILNAGGYTHTSIAIADAVTAINLPVMEVHISNVYAREEYRKTSYIAAKCIGGITGLGLQGYALAIQYFQSKLTPETP